MLSALLCIVIELGMAISRGTLYLSPSHRARKSPILEVSPWQVKQIGYYHWDYRAGFTGYYRQAGLRRVR